MGLEPATSASEPRWHPTLVLYKTPTTVQTGSLRHGQFQEKENTPTTELSIFLSNKNSTENNWHLKWVTVQMFQMLNVWNVKIAV